MDYQKLYSILLNYANNCWSGLYTSPEDLVQETMIYVFKHEEEIKNLKHWDKHCCRVLYYIAHNTLLKEHKDGLWMKVSTREDYNIHENKDKTVTHLFDPWLDDYKERRRASGKKRYHKDRERRLENQIQYYYKNKDRAKAYYRKNKDKLKEKAKEQYYKHKEELIKIQTEYFNETGKKITLKEADKIYKSK